jgi:hypothetical protein
MIRGSAATVLARNDGPECSSTIGCARPPVSVDARTIASTEACE